MGEEQKTLAVQQRLLEIEEQAVQALKNTFANLQLIDFDAIHYNQYSGSYRIFLTIGNSQAQQVTFSIGYLQGDDHIADYGGGNEQVQIRGKTTSQVMVKYSNGREANV
ncbi:hypothetical protein ACSFB8_03110 [Enterococcus faecalis]